MKLKQHISIVIVLLLGFVSVFAQSQSRKEIQVDRYLAKAKSHMKDENWRDSALTLGKILELGGAPPAEFYFLLGKTFVRGEDFENGRNLLDEYLALTRGKGEHHKEVLELMQEIKQYEKGRCPICSGKGWTEAQHKCSKCYGLGHLFEEDKKCYGKGYERCRICGGSGRLRHQRRTYTCDKCDGSGKVPCAWCKGTGHVRTTNCETCSGSGTATSQVYCKNCDGDGRIDDRKPQENDKAKETPASKGSF